MDKILNPEWAGLPKKERMQKMFEIIEQTFVDGRCTDEEYGLCQYLSNKQYPGCAIGMFIPDDKLQDSLYSSLLAIGGVMPPWMVELPMKFLNNCQKWHDNIGARPYLKEGIIKYIANFKG